MVGRGARSMSLAQRITQNYGGKWHGNYGCIPTPGHSKSDRGTKVEDKADAPDGLLVHVFNGNQTDALAVKDMLRRDGFLPPFEPQRANDNSDGWRCTGTYDFRDEAGMLLYRTRRHEHRAKPKRFTAERPDGAGGWTSNMGDVRRVLYRLPELLTADPAEPVYLTEGERKADKLAGWGFTATAFAFGAKSWRKEYAKPLSGRTVIILPDNDANGRDMADRACLDIAEGGGTAYIVELPGLPDKGDIIDWTGTADDLRGLIAKALAGEPEDLLPLADLAAWATRKPTPKRHLMAGFIPEHEVTLLVGAGGVNKSTYGQQLCASYAAQRPMLGVELQSGTALYITAEDHFERLHWMHDHICHAVRIEPASLAGKLHLSSVRGQLNNELATFDAENRIRPTAAFYRLKATLKATGATLLVLDNVAHMYAGNENDRAQVTAFVNLLYSLCLDLGVTVVLIAHPNKAGDSYSGSTAWLNAVRSQLIIECPDASIDPDERVLKIGKANYGRPGTELRFRWYDFALVRENDLPPDTRGEMAAVSRANWENEVFLRCLAARNANQRAVSDSPSSPTYAPRVFVKMPEARGATVDGLERAMDRLFRLGSIKANQQLWKRPNRTWVSGLAAAQDPAQDPAQDGCIEPHTTPSQVSDIPCTGVHAPHRPYTTYMEGAAREAAAPIHEEGEVPDDFLPSWGSKSEAGL
jgi:RecA-family ATPase